MGYLLLLTISVVGFSGIVAQVLLLRELLVSFYGNELTLGIILANWVMSEALGVFVIGKYIDKLKNKIDLFIALEIIFSLTLPLSIYLSRVFKDIIGIPFGEAIGLSKIFFSSLFIILPVSFCHGALFSSGCKIYSLYRKSLSDSIGKVYAWEAIGTIIGGIITTYFFIPYLNSFQIALAISLSNLIICLLFFKHITNAKSKYIILFGAFVLFYLFLSGNISYINSISIDRQFRPGRILEYRNSVYGNIAVTQRDKQYTFFYNGIPTIITPYPDITFVEEFGHLPLLFHRAPSDVLILSSGAGGLINEVLKHPIRKLDYAELDPLLIHILKKYPTALTKAELEDKRVNVINLDGRFFIKNTLNQYDIVLIGLSKPVDLSVNRLFTQEFFALVKKRLNSDGILALWLPGSLAYLSQELKDLNACILNGLRSIYDYVRVIPGDYNIFLASDSKDILDVNAALITQRINQRNIQTNILIPSYIDYRLDRQKVEWFKQCLLGSTGKINQDLRPFAVFKMLILWNKQFFPSLPKYAQRLEDLDLRTIALLVSLATALLLFIFYRKTTRLITFSIAYSVATTGFFGMLINLILIFSFQVFYGYLYHRIGILMAIFMTGIALGTIFMTRHLGKIKNDLRLFIRLEILTVGFSYFLTWIITKGMGNFTVLFFISGMLMGLEFPLASKIYLGKKGHIGQVAGLLYCSDLMGGWIAGIFAGIVFLPILGLFNTCLVIVMLKLSSLILLMVARNRLAH